MTSRRRPALPDGDGSISATSTSAPSFFARNDGIFYRPVSFQLTRKFVAKSFFDVFFSTSTSTSTTTTKNVSQYSGEADLPLAMSLVDAELSEPYSIFTYRYFLRNWPHLCFLAFDVQGQQRGGEEDEEEKEEEQQRNRTPPPPPPPPPAGSRGGGCHHSVPTPEGDCFGVIINKMDEHRGEGKIDEEERTKERGERES